MLGDHNLFRKTWPYEASTRMPFLMRAPQKYEYSKEITGENPVGIQGIMPTILVLISTFPKPLQVKASYP